jgi:DNA polymerase elongation subunit (family B)
LKILAWDLECSNLAADFGIILCCGFKEVGTGKPKVLDILDYVGDDMDLIKAEKRLLKDISKELLDSDVWLTHFGTYYDIPFVNTRLLYHDLPVVPSNFAHIDTWKIAKNRLKLRNNRLITVSEFLGTEEEKNAIKPEQWIRALGGHAPSMRYIVEHCRRDVVVLEEAYLRLRPLVLDHPNRGLIDGRGGCSVCGETKLQKRGFHVTRTRKYQRFQCTSCGGWSKGTKPVEIAKAA